LMGENGVCVQGNQTRMKRIERINADF